MSASEHLQKPAIEAINAIDTLFKTWSQGASQLNSLAIVGHRGSGKTCLLDYLDKQITAVCVLRGSVPGKLTQKKQVLSFFSMLLDLPTCENLENFCLAIAKRPKTVIMLDDAHNLFLSTQGGFAGYYSGPQNSDSNLR